MFAISLSYPQWELWESEVSVGRWDNATVERMAINEESRLCAWDSERQPVPRAVSQPEGERLDPRHRAAGRHVVQPDLVAATARLHLQVPAHRHTDALMYWHRSLTQLAAFSKSLRRALANCSEVHINKANNITI